MKVSTTQPFEAIYALFLHEYLGYLVEAFVVQVNSKKQLTLQYQNISSKNAPEFSANLDKIDFELVSLMDNIQPEAIIKKFYNKKITPTDFFLKIYHKEKGDKPLQEAIESYIDAKKAKILALILTLTHQKRLFVMGTDGNPAWQEVQKPLNPVSILFHFFRNEENTHYFPTLKHEGNKLEFQYKNALILCNEPAYLLVNNNLYHFQQNIDGHKLRPFLNKKFINIPKNVEEMYFKKFVAPLVATFDVHAEGFSIKTEQYPPETIINFTENINKTTPPATASPSFKGGEQTSLLQKEGLGVVLDNNLTLEINFKYGDFSFLADENTLKDAKASVNVEKTEKSFIFHRIKKDNLYEQNVLDFLKENNIYQPNNQANNQNNKTSFLGKNTFLNWANNHTETLKTLKITLQQNKKDNQQYFLGTSSINIVIKEVKDWFDINAKIMFGAFEVPFLKLRKYILAGKTSFTLPDGEIAIIPQMWLDKYADLFHNTQHFLDDENNHYDNHFQLQKHHFNLVQELKEAHLAEVDFSKKLNKLRNFEEIEDYALPLDFVGELRPYQKAGYNWMRFLADFGLGGCLADDMGLGKTIQTIALLLSEKESQTTPNPSLKVGGQETTPNPSLQGQVKVGGQTSFLQKEGLGVVSIPSLIVLPTSLVHNWVIELAKFAPTLRVFVHTGTNREKKVAVFGQFDVIITTYGIIRIDTAYLEKILFNYVILDESQAIKNPSSNIAKAVLLLRSKKRLILTGTPIENTTMDLWSQMNFINRGLLGTQNFFRKEFLNPIEKQESLLKLKKLYATIKPFILRRDKKQVAKELPDKVESVLYCKMSKEQNELYERTKSQYRNQILEEIELNGVNKSQILLLQGLTQLRQIANHPKMIDKEYGGTSGKMEQIIDKMAVLLENGKKMLIFSQFVKHLSLVREYLDTQKVPYAYLDGSIKDRQTQVENFQNDENIKVFLISLKAGGVGLNLTAAEYVFLLDPWWNPAAEAQAIDRAHRIGQKNVVFTYKFISKNTVEEKILALQNNKKKLANDLINVEESFMKSLSKEDIMALLE